VCHVHRKQKHKRHVSQEPATWVCPEPGDSILHPIVILFSHLHLGFPSSLFVWGFATRTFYVFLYGAFFPPKKFCRMLSISQCYKFVFSGALSTQSRLFHVNRNSEVYAKYCIFTHYIYCVAAVSMTRHVPFDIVIGCISRLLDSVFFIIETDYRNTHNHSCKITTFVILYFQWCSICSWFFASILLVQVNNVA
jgi:hypothetical protein